MSAILFLYCTPGRKVAMTTIAGGKGQQLRSISVLFVFSRTFPMIRKMKKTRMSGGFQNGGQRGIAFGSSSSSPYHIETTSFIGN